MNKLLVGAIVVVAAVAVIVLIFGTQDLRLTEPQLLPEQTLETVQVPERQLVVQLSEQSSSGIYGAAILTETQEGLLIVLGLDGTPQDVPQPAHIHRNTCENIGEVLHALQFPVNGSSETLLLISMDELLADYPLSINVHKSTAEPQIYVACGNITI